MTHTFTLKVYIEDTDLGGIVYHANYLRFVERARSEWVAELGVDQNELRAREGIGFVVRRIEADYLAPARFGDVLTVETVVAARGNSRLELDQIVRRGDVTVFAARVVVVAVGATGRPVRLPAVFRR